MKSEIDRLELYTDKDMTSFGNYLLSHERNNIIVNHPEKTQEEIEQSIQRVSHADFENWKAKYKPVSNQQ